MEKRQTRYAAAYLVLQALLVSLWWIWVLGDEQVRRIFVPARIPDEVLLSFLAADAFILVLGSIAAAIQLLRSSSRAFVTLLITTGGLLYGTLHCIGWMVLDPAAWPALAFMILPTLITGGIAVLSRSRPPV